MKAGGFSMAGQSSSVNGGNAPLPILQVSNSLWDPKTGTSAHSERLCLIRIPLTKESAVMNNSFAGNHSSLTHQETPQETWRKTEWPAPTDSTGAKTDSDPLIFMYLHSHHSFKYKRRYSRGVQLTAPTCAWYATGFVTVPFPPVFLEIPKVIRPNCSNCREERP